MCPRLGVGCLCRLTRNALAHGAAPFKELLPDPLIEELPVFNRSNIAVCCMLPELLGYSEVEFIAKVVDMITDLAMGHSAPSNSSALPAAALPQRHHLAQPATRLAQPSPAKASRGGLRRELCPAACCQGPHRQTCPGG